MSNAIVLCILELVAIASCGYGLYFLAYSSGVKTVFGFVYTGLWFIMGLLSNICGELALYFMYFGPEEENYQTSQYFIQYHYLCAWLTIVVGYPSFVTQAWMVHYPSPWAYLHVLLSIIPMVAWIQRNPSCIVTTTQVSTLVALLSQAYISYLAGNVWGYVGAAMMIVNVISLSMPPRYSLWGFSSRELNVIGLAVTSYIFCLAVAETGRNPVLVNDIDDTMTRLVNKFKLIP